MWLLIRFTAVMITLTVAALAAITLLYAHAVATDRRHRVPSCPCCTNAPFAIPDCLCREPCGVEWCQAAGPEPDIDLGQPEPEPGSEREANLLLARWLAEGDSRG